MANYDYKEGKKRVNAILNDENDIEEKDKVPTEKNFTYHNGYYAWVTALFVDIKDSTKLFSENKKKSTSKIIKSFTSEIIEILRKDNNLREIGIRGDCVYAIYTCSTNDENYEVADKAFYINTYLNMLNKLLSNKKMPNIEAGIGVSKAKELVVKAGKEGSGINNLVWIGKAVTYASKFSSMANRGKYESIIFSDNFYNSIIKIMVKQQQEVKDWFTKHYDSDLGVFYSGDIIKTSFNNWIDGGMK